MKGETTMDELTFTQITNGARAWLNYIKTMPTKTAAVASGRDQGTAITIEALREDDRNWQEGESQHGDVEFYSGTSFDGSAFIVSRDSITVRFSKKGKCGVMVCHTDARGVETLEQLAMLRQLLRGSR